MTLGREQHLPEDFWAVAAETAPSSVEAAESDARPATESDEESVGDTSDGSTQPEGPFKRDFVNDVPAGTGLGPEAKVWGVYNEYAKKYDEEMLGTYKDGTDNLLIFAALFSAAVTAFLVLSLPLLQTDPSQATLDALMVISAQLSAQSAGNGAAVGPYQASGDDFAPTSSVICINGLWIMSLFVSLSTSVLAMLVKQWMRVYSTSLPSTDRERANERQSRYDGLVGWQVAGIANALPVLIHLAVALFLIGLTMYLSNLSRVLRDLMMVCVVLGGVGYLCLASFPLLWSHCPYKSPVTSGLRLLLLALAALTAYVRAWIQNISTKESLHVEGQEVKDVGAVDTLLQANDLEQAAKTMTWLVQHSSDVGVAKTVLAACFSWQDELIPTERYTRFKATTGAVFAHLPHVCVLLSPPERYDPTALPWEQFEPLLIDAVIACSALREFPEKALEERILEWAWSYPHDLLTVEELAWYFVLVGHITAKKERLGEFKHTDVDGYIAQMFGHSSEPRSLFVYSMVIKYATEIDSYYRSPEFRDFVYKFVASSISLPVEFLCVCRLVWDGSWRRMTAGGLALSSMDDFFWPLIAQREHSGLSEAAMKLLTTQVEEGMLSSLDISKTIECLLRWFRNKDHLFPAKQLALANSGLREDELPHEKNLLRACVNEQSNNGFAIPCEFVDLAELLDVVSTRISAVWINTHLGIPELQLLFRRVEELGLVGRFFDQKRVLLWASYILHRFILGFDGTKDEERLRFLPIVTIWLAFMCKSGMLEMHLGVHEFRYQLYATLWTCIRLDVLLLKESRVMEKFQALHDANEIISWRKWDEDTFKELIDAYTARLEDLPRAILVQGESSAYAEPSGPTEHALLPHGSPGWHRDIASRLNPLPLLTLIPSLRRAGPNSLVTQAGTGDVEMALVARIQPSLPSVSNAGAEVASEASNLILFNVPQAVANAQVHQDEEADHNAGDNAR